MKTNNKHKAHAFWGAAFVLLATLMFTGCKQSAGGSDSGIVGTVHEAPFVEGGASLILSPDKLDIKVKAVTSDGNPVVLEGCTETTLANDTETELHATGTTVILKGNIIKLYCGENQLTALNVQDCTALPGLWCNGNQLTTLNVQGCTALERLWFGDNQLTELNVQGCTALKTLWCFNNQLTELNVQGCSSLKWLVCYGNRLNADAFKKLFDDLPQRDAGDNAGCTLYTEEPGVTEGNHTDFSTPSDLAAAFNTAKTVKKWKMYKYNGNWPGEEI